MLGFVGRFSNEINVGFLIETFNKLLSIDNNYLLMLVGDGVEKDMIKEMIDKFNLKDKVIFAGVRNNIDFMMSAFDTLLFPSIYEGLPIVLIEAQSSGLPCLVSTGISKDAKITSLVTILNLSSEKWIDQIIQSKKCENRKNYAEIVMNSEYDLKFTVKEMEDLYLKIINS